MLIPHLGIRVLGQNASKAGLRSLREEFKSAPSRVRALVPPLGSLRDFGAIEQEKRYFWGDAMKKKPAGKFRTKEEWQIIRAMVEKEGMTLTAAAEKAGMPYSTVQGRARIECWNPPHGIIRGRPRDTEILAAQARKIETELVREEVLLMAEASLVKAQDLEVLARKNLVADSARLKVAISRRVMEIVARLEDSSVPVRSAAQALGSLAPILRLIDGWSREPEVHRMERTVTSYADDDDLLAKDCPNNAVNLRLIATTPEQMRQLVDAQAAKERSEKSELEANSATDGQDGAPATECNGQGASPSAVGSERPGTFPPVSQAPKKEAPTGPAMSPLLAPEQPVQGGPRSSPATQELERRREAFQQAKADHRRACREKYR